jgi:hypothetical protein
MSSSTTSSSLCWGCSMVTLADLVHGYVHPLPYRDTIYSGRECKLCRLIVCGFARRQNGQSPYEVNRYYDGCVNSLLTSDAVERHNTPATAAEQLGPIMEQMVPPPQEMTWEIHKWIPGLCGSYSDGVGIQISAPEGSPTCPSLIALILTAKIRLAVSRT